VTYKGDRATIRSKTTTDINAVALAICSLIMSWTKYTTQTYQIQTIYSILLKQFFTLPKPEVIPTNLPKNLENTSTEEPIATFNVPFFGDFPIPAPEVIASSVIAAGTASVVSVAGGIAMQAVVGQIKKIFKKIFTKVLKKEVKNFQTKKD